MITKGRSVFDLANASEGDTIGAKLLDSAGTGLTSTLNSGKQSLDVNVTSPIDVDLDASTDSVVSWTADGAGNAIGSTGGALHISDAGGSLTVDATNFDIRDLAFATDKVDVSGSSVSISGTVAVTQSTSPWVIGDGGGSITVDAVNLDIRDLAFATDSVTAYQGTSPWVVNDAALANTALLNTQLNVTTTSGVLLASQQANRKYLFVQNLGNRSIYIGASGVTTSTGIKLAPENIAELRMGAAISLHAVTDSGTQDTRILEAS